MPNTNNYLYAYEDTMDMFTFNRAAQVILKSLFIHGMMMTMSAPSGASRIEHRGGCPERQVAKHDQWRMIHRQQGPWPRIQRRPDGHCGSPKRQTKLWQPLVSRMCKRSYPNSAQTQKILQQEICELAMYSLF